MMIFLFSDLTTSIILLVGLLLAVVASAYQNNEIDKLKKQLSDLDKENAVLKTKLEMKDSKPG